MLESVAAEPGTIIVLEAPHRLTSTLQDMLLVLGDRRLAVCREMTKLFEETFRGTVREAIAHFTEPRGEFTLVIEGRGTPDKPELTENIERQLQRMYLAGATAKKAVAAVAGRTGLKKKELYQTWLRLDKVWEREKDEF